MWQMQAIQLLKRFNNDLEQFINKTVLFNSRFEKVDFGPLHKEMLQMGELNSRQLREGMDVLQQIAGKNIKPPRLVQTRKISSLLGTSADLASVVGKTSNLLAPYGNTSQECNKADFWSNSHRNIPKLKKAKATTANNPQ